MNNEPQYGTMDQVVVRRDDLLKVLKENKEKHDFVLKGAVEGYWVSLGKKLEEKKVEFEDKIKEVNDSFTYCFDRTKTKVEQKKQVNWIEDFNANISFTNHFGLPYPTNHGDDYDKIIRMAKMSVHNEFRLTSNEFDCYILNKWAWKEQFKTQSLGYISYITGCYPAIIRGTSNAAFAFSGAAF